MKLTKKKVLVLSLAACIIATLSMGTLAWFFSEDNVTNEFTVLDSLTSFEIDLWERVQDDVIGRGRPDGDDGMYIYSDVVPGGTYEKEVYVENTSGNALADQYVKVEVTFTRYSVLNQMGDPESTELFDCTTMLENKNFSSEDDDTTTAWYCDPAPKYNEGENTVTYVFYLREVLKYSDNVDDNGVNDPVLLFSGVTIPETMDINDAANLKNGGFSIKIVAYAIQSANIKAPNSQSTLEDVMYAFGDPWDNRTTEPAEPEFPVTTPNV